MLGVLARVISRIDHKRRPLDLVKTQNNYNNYNNGSQSGKSGAYDDGGCNGSSGSDYNKPDNETNDLDPGCNSCNYSYTLTDNNNGTYRTDSPDLDAARAALVERYGDSLATVVRQSSV